MGITKHDYANLRKLKNSLTMADAEEYEGQAEKIMWIETTLCDPNDVPRELAEVVEERLISLLNSAA